MAQVEDNPDAIKSPSQPVDTDKEFDPAGVAGKTILITGGAAGLGAAFAKEWASNGANIIIGDVDDGGGEKLVAEIRKSTGSEHHHYQHCDVTDWYSQVSLFKFAANMSPTGFIDAVVPNAGIAHDGSPANRGFENPPLLDCEHPHPPNMKILDVNLTGVMYTCHLALFWLAQKTPIAGHASGGEGKQKDRHLLLIGSIAGLLPLVGSAPYTASKHAVTGMFRCLRGSAIFKGIRVNMLCPYFIDTKMVSNIAMAFLAGGGLGETRDVVEAGTRFMADNKIWGRSVVIGPRMKVEDGPDGETRLVGIPREGDEDAKGIWDVYTHDYEYGEAVLYRYTRLLIGYARLRGWIGWFVDVIWALFKRDTKKM